MFKVLVVIIYSILPIIETRATLLPLTLGKGLGRSYVSQKKFILLLRILLFTGAPLVGYMLDRNIGFTDFIEIIASVYFLGAVYLLMMYSRSYSVQINWLEAFFFIPYMSAPIIVAAVSLLIPEYKFTVIQLAGLVNGLSSVYFIYVKDAKIASMVDGGVTSEEANTYVNSTYISRALAKGAVSFIFFIYLVWLS